MSKIWFYSIWIVLILFSFSHNRSLENTPEELLFKIKDTIITGKVVGIMDGDTFKLLTQDSTLIKVRLANIDCPEKKQPFSTKAKQFISEAIFSKIVEIQVLKKDRYRRFIANVKYNDSLNLNYELVKNGFAWHYVKYSKDKQLQSLEDTARIKKVGLWQDKKPIAPWIWRDYKKRKK
ncbi:endonuclease YncB(thermonuclease family) [Tenacibaculum adriaticum]|uniref:Endonuclease YncB(Thermonuclease family) n=1 Tax=Tenacibaculum adriaticum TaxID=413713 RepID=A0A5S5DSV0_9FLAO|nr:thermonuclease family protein [Tenacibaculum adriaticum]TYP99010.1 endonuclease YncB(thermonuclease family) [Tenacibaculum adriaticum]